MSAEDNMEQVEQPYVLTIDRYTSARWDSILKSQTVNRNSYIM